jgi:hypothetical protein
MKLIRLAAIAAGAAALAGCMPKPPTAPPPAPKFTLGAGLWHTFGNAPGSGECHFMRIGADGTTLDDVHSYRGPRYVETAATDSEFVTSGCQPWVRAGGPDDALKLGTKSPNEPGGPTTEVGGDGDYRVGVDIPWGTYAIQYEGPPTPSSCHWQRLSSFAGGADVLGSGDGNGDGLTPTLGLTFSVRSTDVGLRVSGCAPIGHYMFWLGTPVAS